MMSGSVVTAITRIVLKPMVGAMDGIFSNELSNTLQYFTFPLEVVGRKSWGQFT